MRYTAVCYRRIGACIHTDKTLCVDSTSLYWMANEDGGELVQQSKVNTNRMLLYVKRLSTWLWRTMNPFGPST